MSRNHLSAIFDMKDSENTNACFTTIFNLPTPTWVTPLTSLFVVSPNMGYLGSPSARLSPDPLTQSVGSPISVPTGSDEGSSSDGYGCNRGVSLSP